MEHQSLIADTLFFTNEFDLSTPRERRFPLHQRVPARPADGLVPGLPENDRRDFGLARCFGNRAAKYSGSRAEATRGFERMNDQAERSETVYVCAGICRPNPKTNTCVGCGRPWDVFPEPDSQSKLKNGSGESDEPILRID